MDTTIDVPQLCRLWRTEDLTVSEVARELRVTAGMVYRLARRYGLEPRKPVMRAFSMEDAESPEEEEASADSLALAPAVQRRIVELGYGGPK